MMHGSSLVLSFCFFFFGPLMFPVEFYMASKIVFIIVESASRSMVTVCFCSTWLCFRTVLISLTTVLSSTGPELSQPASISSSMSFNWMFLWDISWWAFTSMRWMCMRIYSSRPWRWTGCWWWSALGYRCCLRCETGIYIPDFCVRSGWLPFTITNVNASHWKWRGVYMAFWLNMWERRDSFTSILADGNEKASTRLERRVVYLQGRELVEEVVTKSSVGGSVHRSSIGVPSMLHSDKVRNLVGYGTINEENYEENRIELLEIIRFHPNFS